MNREIVRTAPASTADQPGQGGSDSTILKLLWIVPGAAVLCLALFLSVGRTKLSESGIELVVVFIYSAFIGPPAAFLCNWIGHRYTDRFPRFVILFYALALLFAATAGCLVSGFPLRWMGIVRPDAYWHEFWGSWAFALVITLMVGLSISTFETLRHKLQRATLELRTREMEQERANKLLAEARLSSLESRIHPHFLFNTLNSIAALIPTDPQRAEDTVGKLASLLRFSLNANHSSLVPLSQELKIVHDYLQIESTRFGPRLRYEITVPEALEVCKVPPLSLQTLVENSVKHVAARRSDGAQIQIRAKAEAGRICLEVVDDGPGFSLAAVSPEHGIGNLIGRLELLFGDAGRLDVTRDNEKTVLRMSFPAES